MSEYKIGEAAEILGVSPDTVRRWADAGRLRCARTGGGHRVIDGAELARFALTLPARTATEPVAAQSSRNRLTGIVTRVVKDRVCAHVEIQAGPFRVTSLMTREAVDELGLTPGMEAVAAIKATNVVVELPVHR